LYRDWKLNNGVLHAISSTGVEQYSRKATAAQLAEILDKSILPKST